MAEGNSDQSMKNEEDKSKNREARIEKDVEIEDLNRGDHIGVTHFMGTVEYQHHGIFLGHTKGVAHFGGDSKKNSNVVVVSLKTFCSDLTTLIRFIYADGDFYGDDEKAAKNADSWLEDPDDWPEYNLLRQIYDHFSTICKTGVYLNFKRSTRVWENLSESLEKPSRLNKYSPACSCAKYEVDKSKNSTKRTKKDVEIEYLKRGDHIGVIHFMGTVEYQHHGIFLGHNKSVAHFGGDSKINAKVGIVSLKTFCSDLTTLIRFVYADCDCSGDDEIAAKNAESLVEHPDDWPEYNLLRNNCEHFATVCKTGVKRSTQVLANINKLLNKPSRLKKYAYAGCCACGSFGSS